MFDLYGTLVTSSHANRVVRPLLAHVPAQQRRQLARRWMTSCEDPLETIGDSELRRALQSRLDADRDSVDLFPETTAVLVALRRRGLRLGLVSNLSAGYRQPVDRLKLRDHFDSVVFSCELGILKPNRRIFEHACAQLGVSPRHTTMVGDSLPSDIRGAEQAGLHAVLVDRTRRHEKTPGVRRRIRDLRGLL